MTGWFPYVPNSVLGYTKCDDFMTNVHVRYATVVSYVPISITCMRITVIIGCPVLLVVLIGVPVLAEKPGWKSETLRGGIQVCTLTPCSLVRHQRVLAAHYMY